MNLGRELRVKFKMTSKGVNFKGQKFKTTSKSVNFFFTPFALNLRRIIHKFKAFCHIKFVDSSPFCKRLVNDKNAVIARCRLAKSRQSKIQAKFKHCEKSHEKGGESLVKFGYNFVYEKND